jgi:hypothetical protein
LIEYVKAPLHAARVMQVGDMRRACGRELANVRHFFAYLVHLVEAKRYAALMSYRRRCSAEFVEHPSAISSASAFSNAS